MGALQQERWDSRRQIIVTNMGDEAKAILTLPIARQVACIHLLHTGVTSGFLDATTSFRGMTKIKAYEKSASEFITENFNTLLILHELPDSILCLMDTTLILDAALFGQLIYEYEIDGTYWTVVPDPAAFAEFLEGENIIEPF